VIDTVSRVRNSIARDRALTPVAAATRRFIRRCGIELVTVHDGTALNLHLWRLFEQLDIGVVLDVGARTGEYGRSLRRNGYRGRIISFEPVGENFAILSERAANDPAWSVQQIALGNETGRSEINVTNSTVFSSFRAPNQRSADVFGSGSEIKATETVEVRRLDDVFDDLVPGRTNVFLKIDTQGWDLEVLRGAAATLPRVAALQTEVSVQPIYEGMPTMQDALEYLDRAGFAVSGLFPVTLDQQLRVVEFDCIAVRA
jgi:FkbM family methyltransferase